MTAKIKLNAASGGGSVSLKAPSATTSNAAVELQLPVADGSANQLLKTDGSGNLSWVADTNDYVKLQSFTGGGGSTNIIIDNLDTSTYRAFDFFFAAVPSADGQYPYFRFRTGGSSGADDTSSHYNWSYTFNYPTDSTAVLARSDNNTSMIGHTVGYVTADEGVNGVMRIFLHRSGDSLTTGMGGSFATFQTNVLNESGGYRSHTGTISYNNSSETNHTGFVIYMGSGVFNAQQYALYGLKG